MDATYARLMVAVTVEVMIPCVPMQLYTENHPLAVLMPAKAVLLLESSSVIMVARENARAEDS